MKFAVCSVGVWAVILLAADIVLATPAPAPGSPKGKSASPVRWLSGKVFEEHYTYHYNDGKVGKARLCGPHPPDGSGLRCDRAATVGSDCTYPPGRPDGHTLANCPTEDPHFHDEA